MHLCRRERVAAGKERDTESRYELLKSEEREIEMLRELLRKEKVELLNLKEEFWQDINRYSCRYFTYALCSLVCVPEHTYHELLGE